ncbi:GNAT family N-acetyltransferase [Priestia aryabhattai]|uniref:GNAT family N-acetyltransferase n=1 Tax=Bacillaceae TaxID=186817 RepID=UPI000BA0D83E|nr:MULTISPECIES: GNAT family N-acetyltransferase [Bacillaceae]MDT2046994.1 GNAT family N-acetyltransferase [Priestia flexa]OZT14418.1 GNAT family N-acetyltransferase [Priestia aryabhattai]TDB54772.1 N-acetyltransferase [Bacillus sp. CBEL-1]USY56874.1 GNAT family N-acetyltransferase [Bacillus sp. 1780r2a1]
MAYITTNRLPAFHQFAYLHEVSGLKKSKKASYTKEQLYEAVCNSFYTFSIYDDNQLIAFGRMISDGIYQALICDVMVDPSYQKKGLGKQIINGLISKCNERGIESIQLFAVKGKGQFYKKLGFQERDAEAPGMSLVQ